MKQGNKILLVIAIVIILIVLAVRFMPNTSKEKKSFETDTIQLKETTEQNKIFSKSLKISNSDDTQRNFEIKIIGIDFISIYEKEFALSSGEEKLINLNFNVFGKSPDVYLGILSIISAEEILEIPIILEIESENILFDSNINAPLEYNKVYPGGELVVENKLFNLENIGLSSVDVEYYLKDFNGKIIYSEQQKISFEKEQLNTKVISIPSDIGIGNYVFIAKIKHGNSIGTSTYLFDITDKKYDLISNIPYTWIAIILLLIIILFILYNVRERDKFLLELGKQHKEELSREIRRLNIKKQTLEKLEPVKRKRKLKELKKEKKLRFKAIRKIYKERVKTIKKLRKQKKSNQIERKLNSWKKQGYNVHEFLIKSSKPKSLRKITKEFKEEGYKI